MIGMGSLPVCVSMANLSSVTGVLRGAPFSFQSGMSSVNADGSWRWKWKSERGVCQKPTEPLQDRLPRRCVLRWWRPSQSGTRETLPGRRHWQAAWAFEHGMESLQKALVQKRFLVRPNTDWPYSCRHSRRSSADNDNVCLVDESLHANILPSGVLQRTPPFKYSSHRKIRICHACLVSRIDRVVGRDAWIAGGRQVGHLASQQGGQFCIS